MSILRNGAAADYIMQHNAAELDKITYKGTEELWIKALPYSVAFMDYPMEEISATNYASKDLKTNESGYSLSVKKSGSSVGHGSIAGKATLPTQKCNKVKVKYSSSQYCAGEINGSAIAQNATEQYLIFDCAGESFDLIARAQDETEYFVSTLTISEVSFYYESE